MEQARQKKTLYSGHHPQELAKLIRKLRWIGMEEEAHPLQMAVNRLPPHERYAVLGGPFSTD